MIKEEHIRLAKFTGLSMSIFILLEFIVVLLIMAGVLPPTVPIPGVGYINTMWILLGALVSVLVSSFWIAFLNEVGLIELKEMKF
jgi:hypothetical protein